MSLLHTIIAFLAALALLIVVHELGHFAVARACGVKVLRFSVGFGRTLLMRRAGKDRTEWVLAIFPIGGYVKMLDEQEGSVAPEELHRTFNRQTLWRRALIVAAGPFANFLLAVLLYWGLFIGGITEPRAFISVPEPGSPAAEAGLQRGDLIRKINDVEVATWQEARWKLLNHGVNKATVTLEILSARNEISWRKLNLTEFQIEDGQSDPLTKIGMRLFRLDFPPVIGKTVEGQVAERSGLQAGDRVSAINGREIETWEQVVSVVRSSPGVALAFEIARDGRSMQVALTPDVIEAGDAQGGRYGRIGAAPKVPETALAGLSTTVRYGAVEAFPMAIAKTMDTAWFSLRMIWKMLMGEISWRNLSGPVSIADYAGQSAQMGLVPYIGFLALISISLGVLNLLPVPLLDGGHLMYYAVEAIKGAPVSARAMELGQKVGLALLLVLTAFAFFNDINRLVLS